MIRTVFIILALAAVLYLAFQQKSPDVPVAAVAPEATVAASGLDTPWEVSFLPGGGLLVAERPGRLRVIGEQAAEIPIPQVAEAGEGGFLGIALHPEFETNGYLYVYCTRDAGDRRVNQVLRYVFDGSSLSSEAVIVDSIPAGTVHNGGRIAFGPDGFLYVTTGDTGTEDLAQDRNSLAGKILRVSEDGAIPADNPFKNAVYSYGHRNPQGLAWDEDGGLWATEHGRSGVRSGYDELNYIEMGANYGWPMVQGDEQAAGMRTPAAHSGPDETWAPAGLAYHAGTLYFGGLRGQALYTAAITGQGSVGAVSALYKGAYGRIRAVSVRGDTLYIGTSNRDGRGNPAADDDRVIALPL